MKDYFSSVFCLHKPLGLLSSVGSLYVEVTGYVADGESVERLSIGSSDDPGSAVYKSIKPSLKLQQAIILLYHPMKLSDVGLQFQTQRSECVHTLTAYAAIPPIFLDVNLLQLGQKVYFSLCIQNLLVSLQALAEQGVSCQPSALIMAQVQHGSAGHVVIAERRRDSKVLEPSSHLPLGL